MTNEEYLLLRLEMAEKAISMMLVQITHQMPPHVTQAISDIGAAWDNARCKLEIDRKS